MTRKERWEILYRVERHLGNASGSCFVDILSMAQWIQDRHSAHFTTAMHLAYQGLCSYGNTYFMLYLALLAGTPRNTSKIFWFWMDAREVKSCTPLSIFETYSG